MVQASSIAEPKSPRYPQLCKSSMQSPTLGCVGIDFIGFRDLGFRDSGFRV